jgi:Protein of unknown function (DUF1353)
MSTSFTTPCEVELVGLWKFKILTEFEYHRFQYPAKNEKDIIKVPVGFITDFASIPRIFWTIVSPIDEYAKAAVIHDYLYYTGMFSKAESDLIFKEAMKVLDVKEWKIFCIYNAVKYFGWLAWWKHRREENKILKNKEKK